MTAAFALPGAKWPGLGLALAFSFTATSFARYAKARPASSPALSRLACQLGFGFLVISCIAVIAALIQDIAALKAWAESMHRLAQKGYDLIVYIKGFILNFFDHGTSAAPAPSPTPAPEPLA
jgi:hypothetical protein